MLKQVDLVVENGCILTMDGERRILYGGALAVAGDTILAIGSTKEIAAQYKARKSINAAGKYVFPGFISTHTHLFQMLLKGLGRDKPLLAWLDASVRQALHLYDEESIHFAALAGLLEAVRSGTTTVTDYQYCHVRPGLDSAVIRAYEKLQVRGVLSKAHTDVSAFPPEIACPWVETEDDYFESLAGLCVQYKDHPLVTMSLAPGIIWDHTREGFIRTRKFADQYKIPITMHLAETEDDDRYALATWGERAIPFLESCGVLGPDFVSVHSVHLTPEDIQTFKEYDVSISHCPLSNMILASGAAPVPQLMTEGVNVSLACDGAASSDTQNMLEVLKAAALQHKLVTRDASVVSASEVLEMATLGGARALGLQKQIGSLEKGKKADFFIFDPLKCFSAPVHDPVSALVYSSSPANVETTVIGGEVILENGKFNSIDETAVLKEASRLAASLVKRAGLGNAHWGQSIKPL